jgi:hypothetical protein
MPKICGVQQSVDSLESGGAMPYRLRTKSPTFCVVSEVKPFTAAQFSQYCADAFGRWSKVCGVNFTETTDRRSATFIIRTHDFQDGPSGVLADCQLPTGVPQQVMRLDVQSRWVASLNPPSGSTDVIAVLAHEMGHGIGFVHFPLALPVELMEPYYRAGLRDPQPVEVDIAAKAYGPPKVTPVTPPPPVTPLGDSLGVELIIGKITEEVAQIERLNFTSGGRKYTANGQAKRVKDNQIVTGDLE